MKKRFLTILLSLAVLLAGVGIVLAAVDYYAPLGAAYVQTVDTAFTFAFVGDTQIITNYAYSRLDSVYQFILDRKESDNILFAAGLGDITDDDANWEWKGAVKFIKKLDGKVPYSLIRGNHDSREKFMTYCGYDTYTAGISGMYENILNTYHIVEVGTLKYLFLNLDHGPADDVLAWACDVVEAHPEHNIIVTTHGYINGEGELLEKGTTTIYPSITDGVNDAPAIWDQLVRKYENIVMVVCGHISTAPQIVSYEVTGDHGNKIQQVLVNPQGADKKFVNNGEAMAGMVALFHFSADGTQVQVENYATLRQQHYGSGVTFTLSSMGGNAYADPNATGDFAVADTDPDTQDQFFGDFSQALAACPTGGSSFIRLQKDITADLQVTKNATLDLNGYDVSGNITVAEGCTLSCMDTVTDLYTNTDYGRLTGTITGDLQPVAEGSAVSAIEVRETADPTPYRAGYLKIAEGDGISFHRVDLDLTSISFRPEDTGIRYRCHFSGDAVVARHVKKFGVALSVKAAPSAENLHTACAYSYFDTFEAGQGVNTACSTRLVNVLKPTNSDQQNLSNSAITIYGSAYLQLEDGYVFGSEKETSLKQTVEQADAQLKNASETALESAVDLYHQYTDILSKWNIPFLRDTAEGITEESVLKVLVIGNGHSLDATKLLYEVFRTEAPRQHMVLGVLYHDSCTIENHYLYAKNDRTQYTYYKMDRDIYEENGGQWEASATGTNYDYTMAMGLADEQWDVVVLQQMNTWAGVNDHFKYSYINTVISTVNNVMDVDPVILWHMGWTNPDQPEYLTPNNGISGMTAAQAELWATRYSWYDTDQDVMYEKMMGIIQEYILTNTKISDVIPNGTAIEYAQNELGYTQAQIYRDRTNLTDYAALLSAYVWYGVLMELDSMDGIQLTTIPAAQSSTGSAYTLTETQAADLLTALNHALENPYTAKIEN